MLRNYIFVLWVAAVILFVPVSGHTADKPKKIEFENEFLKMMTFMRTPEQIKAFYEGRGFPKNSLPVIADVCFVTFIVKNKSDTILWLDLNNWEFYSDATKIKRLDRGYWKQRWEKINMPMSSRSTFGWTLMPEQRDLRPDEGVGGSITIPQTKKHFELTAKFFTGDDKKGNPVIVKIEQLQCAL